MEQEKDMDADRKLPCGPETSVIILSGSMIS